MDRSKQLQVLTIVVSLLLHLCFVLGLDWLPSSDFSQKRTEIIEVDFTPRTEIQRKKHQIVDQSDLEKIKRHIKNAKKKVQFLSKNNQRVKVQTTARRTGSRTRNKSRKLSKKVQTSKISKYGTQAASKSLLMGRSFTGFSTSADYIPHVKLAAATALNTDQFVYYTYYERLGRKLKPRWIQRVRSWISRRSLRDVSAARQKTRYTGIEVLLSKEGYVKKIILTKSSGLKNLDQVAIEAFKASSPILNPPKGLVQDDGLIHIHYGFNIDFRPRHYVRKSL